MSRYKILALDLDGTALLNDGVHFAPGIGPACTAAAAAGYTVVVCTGRPRPCLPPGLTGQPWLSYGVLCDGAELWDLAAGKMLWQRPIARRGVAAVLRLAKAHGFAAEAVDAAGRYHLTEQTRALLDAREVSAFHRAVLARCAVPFGGAAGALPGISKMNLFDVPAALGPALAALSIRCYYCEGGCTEVVARKAGKRAAMQSVAAALGHTLADVVALGDSANDAPLLAAAGLGIAMGNAPAEVATAADAVTGKNTEDGAAQAIFGLL